MPLSKSVLTCLRRAIFEDFLRSIAGRDLDFDDVVFNIGAVYKFTDTLSLFANFAQGFSAPDFGRLFRSPPTGFTSVESDLNVTQPQRIEPVGYAEDGRALVGSPQSGKPTIEVKYLGKRMQSHPVHIGTWQSPSLETILWLKSDLILGDFYDRSLYGNLLQIAPTLFPYKDYHPDRDRWQQSLHSLAKIMQRQQQAQQVINQHQQKIAQSKVKLKPVSRNSKVLLLSISGLDQISVFNYKTFAGDLLKDIGFQLALPQLPTTNSEINISLESLPQIDADLIIVMASGNSSVEKVKKEWWQN